MLDYERACWSTGIQRLAGVDEAGRGPWAGPVVAGAVVLAPAFAEAEADGFFRGLTDSKKLTPARREFFFAQLQNRPEISWAVGQADVSEIDTLNILRATHLAMARALAALQPPAEFALVDGLPVKGLPCAHRAIVRGDSLSLSIAAASIIAKVTRDHHMLELDRQFPGYGFAAHKGYGTALHQRALRELGTTPQHRHSFRPIRELLGIEKPDQHCRLPP